MVRTRVGYAGGAKQHPTYRSLGDHTETVQVDYDPTVISYGELLEVFWASHDPSRAAWSRQYMNVIFYDNDEQKRLAEESKTRVAATLGKPVQTAILPATEFTLAEDYHQKYYLRQAAGLWREVGPRFPKLDDLVNSRAAARLNGYVAGLGSPAQLEEELAGLGLSPDTGQQLLAWVTAKSGQERGCPVPK